jgi:AcrR family transcriptional regulator
MSRPADPNARAALIFAARKEFLRHGIVKARIEDITASSGLSKGAFYLHFESKEALFRGLVAELSQGTDSLLELRSRDEEALLRKATSGKRREQQAPLARELEILNRRHDRELLELIWAQRDVAAVLLGGAQGTEFEGVIWAMVDREVRRVSESCDRLKQWGLCRRDVSSEMMGSMLIGSWMLLLRRMTSLREKPDLEAWLDGLTSLLENGIAARPSVPVAANSRRRSPPRTRLRSLP